MAVTLGRAEVGASSSAHAPAPTVDPPGRRSTWPWRCAGSRSRWPATPSSRTAPLLTTFVSGVFLLSFAHQPLTLALVYGDREQFALRRAVFGVSPFVFVVAVVAVLHLSVLALAIVAGLWNAEHTLMQRYGITRIYGRKAGQDEGRARTGAAVLVAGGRARAGRVRSRHAGPAAPARPRRARTRWRCGPSPGSTRRPGSWWCPPSSSPRSSPRPRWSSERRRGADANPAKWLYVGSTAALFAVILVDPIAGLMGFVGAHSLEYFVIVHQSLGRRYVEAAGPDSAPARSPLGRAVRARTGRLGLLRRLPRPDPRRSCGCCESFGSAEAYLVVFFTLGGLHVFYDGFIWKLRRPAVAQSLAIPTS